MGKILFLCASEVRHLLPGMKTVIRVVEQSLVDLAAGAASNPAKIALAPCEGEMALAMLGHVSRARTVGFRASYLDKSSLTTLFDDQTGEPYAIYDAKDLGAMRSGAITALFSREAHGMAKSAMIIGAGRQAHTTVIAMAETLPKIETIWIYGRRAEAVDALIGSLAPEVEPIRLVYSPVPSDHLGEADIVVGASGAGTPDLATSSGLKLGALAVYVGHGIAADVLHNATRVLATNADQMRVTGADLVDEYGVLPAVDAELPDILAGKADTRSVAAGTIAAYNSGMMITDIAVAVQVIRAARDRSIGTLIEFD